MKKVVSVFLCAFLLLSLGTFPVSANDVDPVEDYTPIDISTTAGSHGVYKHDIATNTTTFIEPEEYAPDLDSVFTTPIPTMQDSPNIRPSSIIGTDDRTIVRNPTGVQTTTCRVGSRFDDGYLEEGTGWLLNNRYLITAGHMLYSTSHGGYADHTAVYVGASGGEYLEYRRSKSYYVGGDYVDNDDKQNYFARGLWDDWGIIELDSPVNVSGLTYLGLRAVNSAADMQDGSVYYTQGYPKDLNPDIPIWQDADMYECSGYITGDYPRFEGRSITPRYLDVVRTNIDITHGQSGSPVYTWRNGCYCAEGIIISGPEGQNIENCIILINDWLYNYINDKI